MIMTHTIAWMDTMTSDPTEPFQTFEEGMIILMARMTKAELEVEQEWGLEEAAATRQACTIISNVKQARK